MALFTNSVRAAILAALVLATGCSAGPKGPQGDPGIQGPTGDAGQDGVLPRNDVSGTVTDFVKPLEGVTVTAHPTGATATTDAQGTFSFHGLTEGVWVFDFHLDGFTDLHLDVSVPASPPVTLGAALSRDDAGGGGPAVTAADQYDAGYGTVVTVQAQATGNGPFAYAWTQTRGPAATLTGADTGTVSFTTRDFAASIGDRALANARFDVLGIDPDQANGYQLQVVVTDANGLSTTRTVTIDSTRPSSGIRMVPIGVPVWLQGNGPLVPVGSPPAPQTTWSWTVDASGAPGSQVTALTDPTSQFPRFTPDVIGTYAIKESVSGRSMNVYAGTFRGEMTDTSQTDCRLCHTDAIAPDKFTLWKGTKHYSALQRKIDGEDGPSFGEACLSCHTVGYDESAENNGFDDVEAVSGWTYPAKDQAGNWAALEAVPDLGPLAGIQCESCHGPQVTTANGPHANASNLDLAARISWSEAVCARCHQEAPAYYKGQQWEAGKHSDKSLAILEATVENRGTTAAHCGRCHSAQGFARYADQLAGGYSGLLTKDGLPASATNAADVPWLTSIGLTVAGVEPQTCQACHDPHDAGKPSQLRIYDAVPALPNGMSNVSSMGTGMICAACHNTRNGEHSDYVPFTISYTAPHRAAQADTLFGFNAYYAPRYTPSPHLAVADTCAGCHYKAVTASQAAAAQTSNHSFVVDGSICATCHSSQVDGVALQAAYQTQLDGLGQAIAAKVLGRIQSALLPANGGQYTVRVWDPVSDDYSSTAASNVALTAAPASIDHVEIHGQFGLVLHMPAALTVNLVTASGAAAGSITTADLYVPAGALKDAAGTAVLLSVSPDYAKSLWNYYLLVDDDTKGVHNPGFYDLVIKATGTKVAALP